MSSASWYQRVEATSSDCQQAMPPAASANRARSTGSRSSQPCAAIASIRARASLRYPRRCQAPQRECARRAPSVGSGRPSPSRAPPEGCRALVPGVPATRAVPCPTGGSRPLRQVQHRRRVPRRDNIGLAPLLQHLGGEFTDGLQHRETRFVGRLIETDEALVEELADELDDVAADLVRRAAHRLGHLQVETAAEHRQPVDEAPCPVVQQVVVGGRSRRAASAGAPGRRGIRPSAARGDARAEPGSDPASGADPRRGELDGKRHPVQARRDPGHRWRIGVRDGEGRSKTAVARVMTAGPP